VVQGFLYGRLIISIGLRRGKQKRGYELMKEFKDLKIAVAGTGYVGLSIATLISQNHKVIAVDIISEKVELINKRKSPIQDEYIERYLAEKELNLTATLDTKEAYTNADFVVIAAPTNVYSTNRSNVA
jgi:UDPglucose 6-dehydrogenase